MGFTRCDLDDLNKEISRLKAELRNLEAKVKALKKQSNDNLTLYGNTASYLETKRLQDIDDINAKVKKLKGVLSGLEARAKVIKNNVDIEENIRNSRR